LYNIDTYILTSTYQNNHEGKITFKCRHILEFLGILDQLKCHRNVETETKYILCGNGKLLENFLLAAKCSLLEDY
jgi:hypothetical protein